MLGYDCGKQYFHVHIHLSQHICTTARQIPREEVVLDVESVQFPLEHFQYYRGPVRIVNTEEILATMVDVSNGILLNVEGRKNGGEVE